MRQGAYTPDIAKMVLDEIRKLQASGYLSAKGRKIPYNPPPNTPIYIVNTSGETIPPFGCMQAVGTLEFGGQNYIQVDKPADTDGTSGGYLFNGDREVGYAATDKYGIAFAGPVVRTQSSSSGASAGIKFRPAVGSWTVTEDPDEGQFIQIGPDDIEANVAKVFVESNKPVESTKLGFIRFQIVDASSTSSTPSTESTDDDTACTDREYDAPSEAQAIILQKSSSVVEEVGSTVTVYDRERFLFERELEDIIGKTGFAVLLGKTEEDASVPSSSETPAEWVIVWIDWFRTVQVVTNTVIGSDRITTSFANIKVWDDCTLPDEVYMLETCETASSSSS